jgi:hypothetical protein
MLTVEYRADYTFIINYQLAFYGVIRHKKTLDYKQSATRVYVPGER